MRLIDAEGSFTLNAVDNTGYSLCFGGGIISVIDRYGHVVCEFFADDTPAVEATPAVHGRWKVRHKHGGGFRRYTGSDRAGEQHTITVDERYEIDDLYCSECGKQAADNFLNYCPNCGAKMDREGGEYGTTKD